MNTSDAHIALRAWKRPVPSSAAVRTAAAGAFGDVAPPGGKLP